ncbi:MAG: DNA alkylation repair protein [Chloroflexota bacterium]
MKAKEALQLGTELSTLIHNGQADQAYALLAPILAERTRFPLLERIGLAMGLGSMEAVNPFLQRIAAYKTEGGWVVIGGALKAQLDRDLQEAFTRCRNFIIAADVWYAADIFGERVPGPGLVSYFEASLPLLETWREDPNVWVRLAIGVGAHFWAKRSKGDPALTHKAAALLSLLEPLFTEWEMETVKGIGWGLKTLGKHYPYLLEEWLPQQIHRPHRAIMMRKALTYLTKEQRLRITGNTHQTK